MKTLVFLFILAVESLIGQPQIEQTTVYSLKVTVLNVSNDKGKVGIALHNKLGFMKTPVQKLKASIKDGKSEVVFKNVPPGEYAVVCYHDKNNNNKMDFNFLGIPKEGFGASNNTKNFGPPKYNDAKFEISNSDVSLIIRL